MSYANTFIRVAEDCPLPAGSAPPKRARPSVAGLQHELLSEHPYGLTEEELYVRLHGRRKGLSDADIDERFDQLHAEVYAKPQACLRASPLMKRYGFGAHYDADGRIALHPLGSGEYERLSHDPMLEQLRAMRSTRR